MEGCPTSLSGRSCVTQSIRVSRGARKDLVALVQDLLPLFSSEEHLDQVASQRHVFRIGLDGLPESGDYRRFNHDRIIGCQYNFFSSMPL